MYSPVDKYLDFFKKIAITNSAIINILCMCLHVHKYENFLATYLEVIILQCYTLLSNYSPRCSTAVLYKANLMDKKWFITVAS